MNATQEHWRPVPDHDGYYEVSNHGRVRSLNRVVEGHLGPKRLKGSIMKQYDRGKGHLWVSLTKESARTSWSVHRLVAVAFLGGFHDDLEVCHNDGNPANNHVENLRWDTRSENILDRVRHGTHHQAVKAECNRGHGLETSNLVRSGITRGKRLCLSCSRARSIVRNSPALDMQAVSDSYYKDLGKAR